VSDDRGSQSQANQIRHAHRSTLVDAFARGLDRDRYPKLEQRSDWVHPENSRPSPQ
jgi:hypothetical protein